MYHTLPDGAPRSLNWLQLSCISFPRQPSHRYLILSFYPDGQISFVYNMLWSHIQPHKVIEDLQYRYMLQQ